MQGDFWVVSPCESTAIPGKVLEGTRLTVQRKASPDGFEFTIRTPGTPGRWQEYEVEMAHAWQALQELAVQDAQRHRQCQSRSNDEVNDEKSDASYEASFREAMLAASLTVFFYWVNFGPLSRGSAACGCAVLRACLAAAGFDLQLPALPPNKQLDWEAILRPNPASFIAHVTPWLLPKMLPRRSRSASSSHVSSSKGANGANGDKGNNDDVLASLPSIDAVLPTLRSTIEALNAGD